MNKFIVIIILLTPMVLFGQKWEELITQSDLYHKKNDYDNAILFAKKEKQIAIEDYGMEHENYIISIIKLASYYKSVGNIQGALTLFWEARNILKKSIYNKNNYYVSILNNLGEIYSRLDKYTAAVALYKEARDIMNENNDKQNSIYATILSNLAYANQQLGNYDEALLLFEESRDLFHLCVGSNNPRYASLLNNLGLLYMKIGIYEKAYPLIVEAKNIRFRTLKENHPDYAISLNSLAGLYKSNGNYQAALPLYLEAKNIISKKLGVYHPTYSILLDNLATLYALMHNYKAALSLYEEAIKIKKDKGEIQHSNYAQLLNNIAILYGSMGNNEMAIKFLEESKDIRFNALGDKHPVYAGALHNLALFYYNIDEYNMCKENITHAMDIILSNFDNLDILSEKQKIAYRNVDLGLFYSYYSICMDLYFQDKSIAKNLFKTYLFLQNMLLSSSKKMKEVILESDDNELIDLYTKYKSTKTIIARTYSITSEDYLNTKVDVDSLENISETYERELAKSTKVFKKYINKRNYTWENIRRNLKSNEATVSILRFPYYNKGWTDTIKYIALIVTKEMRNYPKLIELKNGPELESKYRQKYFYSLRTKENTNKSKKNVGTIYNAFWEEIDKELKGKDVVYFCPNGVYHTINLNTIECPDGSYLYENKDIVILSSLMELFEEKEPFDYSKTAILVGNPDYDLDKKSQMQFTFSNTNNEITNGIYSLLRDFRGFTLDPLPGTKLEIKRINDLLKKDGWNTQYYSNKQALEETIKSIKNPRVLHIATHGFFADNLQLDDKRQTENLLFFGVYGIKTIDNPMLRSGLMLSGSQNTLNGDYDLLEQADDGILTGYEAMDLTLDSTELVVLSACETGLGKVIDGEGVYGLQRAFKLAGAKNIIMSLWKVDDNATQLLMRKFYEYWMNGNNKREAFKLAQDYLKKETAYKDPYFWGGFVFIGMDSLENSGINSKFSWIYVLILFSIIGLGVIIQRNMH